ncbi:MAG: ATP-binding protein [Bdellovibrionales bacterium]|nr:ATP-binding protein [Bdellovibrionales bacterium]
MATAEQIKSLIKSHLQDDRERFLTIALQLAACEAHKGHITLARDIRLIIDKQKTTPLKVISFQKDLSDFIHSSQPKSRLADIILEPVLKGRIDKILKEYYQRQKLLKHGLNNRRKILLAGPPGTGKTMTASVIAGELKLPFFNIQMDKIVTKFMGETSAKLRQVFDAIQDSEGVFLFDEFDAIGSERSRADDVGEMRRVLNAFLQFIENDKSNSIIISATNNMKLLDKALFRRFDDVLYYDTPSSEEVIKLITNRLASFLGDLKVKEIVNETTGLSHAEIVQACYDSVKEAILADQTTVSKKLLLNNLENRKSAYNHKEK